MNKMSHEPPDSCDMMSIENFKRNKENKYWFELLPNKTKDVLDLMTLSLVKYLAELERLNICNEENMKEYLEYMKAVEGVFDQIK